MCGIWAIFGLGRKAARGLDSALKISQRGPDLTRFESLPGFKDSFIGFHRLSVLDDAHGLAPVHVNQYPHLQVMANCAIFNWKELGAKHGLQFQTSCDDEVITHLLVEHGVKKIAQWLDGVFSFVAIDKEKKKIHIAHDTFGVRPMFTMTTAEDQLMGVCSEVKGLIHLKREKYNIQPFPPGCCATYDLDPRGKASLVEWGEYMHVGKAPEYDTNVQLKSDDIKYNIRTLLKKAVRKRLMGSRGVGSFLSGGLDSSLVSALVAQCAKESGIAKPIRTFTIGMEGSPDGYRSWISPSLPTTSERHPQDGKEKHLLRAAHDVDNFLPPEILWKTKRDAFGPGASHLRPWFEVLHRHVEQEVTDKDLRNAKNIFPENTPKTKEAFFYRRAFEEFFPGHGHFVPYMWVPKWESRDETVPL